MMEQWALDGDLTWQPGEVDYVVKEKNAKVGVEPQAMSSAFKSKKNTL